MSDIGGLTEFVYIAFWMLYLFFGKPFRDLDLVVSYNKLKNILNDRQLKGVDYEAFTGLCFYIKFFLQRRLPERFYQICCLNDSDSFASKIKTYETLEAEAEDEMTFRYLLSLSLNKA